VDNLVGSEATDAKEDATMTTTITTKEQAVLVSIATDEYRDAGLDQSVWSRNLNVPSGMTRKSMGGVMASLAEKGLVSLGGTGREATVRLLPLGIAALPSEILQRFA
jgi:hypothetical protein